MSTKMDIKKTFNKAEYDKEYNKEHYKKVTLLLKFDDYNKMKEYCNTFGLSFNNFVRLSGLYAADTADISDLKKYNK